MKPRKPLKRSTKPIKRVSSKRAKELRLYSKLRQEYLKSHPYCEVWLKEHNSIEWDVKENGYCRDPHDLLFKKVPLATDIHHVRGRTGWKLNDATYFLAVSREMHEKIHQNPSWARERGYLI